MRRAATLNVGSGGLCMGVGLISGSNVATFEGVESIFGDALFHEFNSRGKTKSAIASAGAGMILLATSEIYNILNPQTITSLAVPTAIGVSLGVNAAAYTGLLPHDHGHEEGSKGMRHELSSKVHAFGDMMGSAVALGASILSFKYTTADTWGAPIQLLSRLSFYRMEVDVLKNKTSKMASWLINKVIARPHTESHNHS